MSKGIRSLTSRYVFKNGQWYFHGKPVAVPKFGYGGDVEGGADQGVNGSESDSDASYGGDSFGGYSSGDVTSSDGYAGIGEGVDNFMGDSSNFGGNGGDSFYDPGGWSLNDADQDVVNAINEGNFDYSGGAADYSGISLGSGSMFGMGLTPSAPSVSLATPDQMDQTLGYGAFAPTYEGIAVTSTPGFSASVGALPEYDNYLDTVAPTTTPSMMTTQNMFESTQVPNIQTDELPPSLSVDFSLNPYDMNSLARPDARWANVVGLTENIGQLAMGNREAFTAPIQNVMNRANVNYSGFGPTIEQQARAPSQYSGINVKGVEQKGAIRGMVASNPELAEEGYGLAKAVLSGELPDPTLGAMSFRGNGMHGQITSRDPNAQNFGGNVFGNMNEQEREYAALAREAHPYEDRLEPPDDRLFDSPVGTAVGAFSIPSAPLDTRPTIGPYDFSVMPMGEFPAGLEERASPQASIPVSGFHQGFDSETPTPNFAAPSLQERQAAASLGFHQGFDSEVPTPNFAAPSLQERLDEMHRQDRIANFENYNLPGIQYPNFDEMAARLQAELSGRPAPPVNTMAYDRSLSVTMPAIPEPTVVSAPPRVSAISPEAHIQSTAPAQTAQPTAKPVADEHKLSPLIGKGVELGTNIAVGMIPGVGTVNTLSGLFGGLFTGEGLFHGPTVGGLVRGVLDGKYANGPVEGGPALAPMSGGETYPMPAMPQQPVDPVGITDKLDSLTQVRPVAFNHAAFYVD